MLELQQASFCNVPLQFSWELSDSHLIPSSHTTIHLDDLSINPPTLIPRQESHRFSHFLGRSQPSKRAEIADRLNHLIALPFEEEICRRGTRSDGIDTDPLASEVFRHDADHLLDGALGGVVEEIGGRDGRGVALRRGDEDDV